LLRELYRMLLQRVVAAEFPRSLSSTRTRMFSTVDNQGLWSGDVIDQNTTVAIVDMARAGNRPSDICFDLLHRVLAPIGVRQDHLMMARKTDNDGRVIGVDISGSKIDGSVGGRFILFPDPMGATGTSLAGAVSVYKEQVEGTPRGWIALNLIITPEYIRRVCDEHPEVVIYAFRLDCGLSPEDVLRTIPGRRWEEEVGLTTTDYIVPGAGGLGEVINNAFV